MFKKIMTGVLCGALILSLGACGGKDKNSSSSTVVSSGVESVVSSDVDVQIEDPGVTIDKFATVLDLLNDEVTSAAINATIAQMGDSDKFIVSVVGSDDTLSYIFQFKDDYFASVDEESIKSEFDTLMENNANSFQAIANGLVDLVEIEKPKVEVLYLKPDGTDMLNYEYVAGDSDVTIDSILTDADGNVVEDEPEGFGDNVFITE